MKTFIILALAVVAALAEPKPSLRSLWADFKSAHKKEYSNPLEEMRRMVIFRTNLAKIEEHNAKYEKGEVTYSKSMNHFGDLTEEEFMEYVNRGLVTRPKEQKDHTLPWVPSAKPLATAADWRGKAVTEVKDQGRCGSCWSFSATGALEGQLAAHGADLVSLSEQNLMDCSSQYGNNGCDGGWMDFGFDYVHDFGIMSESSYPYEAETGQCRFDPSQSVTKLRGYYDIPSRNETDLADAISNYGPVAIAFDATQNLQFYNYGIFNDITCSQTAVNHGVLAVGYGSEGGRDYWIVKNSWGGDWGDDGYYKTIRNKENNCGIATAASFPAL